MCKDLLLHSLTSPKDGEWRTLTKAENPERIIQVSDHNNGSVLCTLEQKEVMEVHRTLGYHLNIVDSNEEVVKMHITKAKQFNTAVLQSNLKLNQKGMAYCTRYFVSLCSHSNYI